MDVQLLMEVMLKGADLSDAVKAFDAHKKWTLRITNEFFLQGDMERASGME
jgi:cAMP-specific phosphodiesterase